MLVEDAAHAIPAKYKGRPSGSGANPVSFSFYATKNLTTAEGGMLTGSRDLIDPASSSACTAWTATPGSATTAPAAGATTSSRPGFKYNMTDIQAAIGLQQLRRLDAMHARRREIVKLYDAAFGEMGVFELPSSAPTCSTPGTSTRCGCEPTS